MFKSKSAAMFSGRESEGLVLVVDDEPDIRKVVRMTLEKSGYDVVEAEDGEKAIEEIKKGEHTINISLIIKKNINTNRNTIEIKKKYKK